MRSRRVAPPSRLAAVALLSVLASAAAAQDVAIAGTWKMDVAASDDPAELMRGRGGPGGPGGFGGGPGGPGGPASRFEAVKSLRILLETDILTVVDATGHERRIILDGQKQDLQTRFGTSKISGSWKKNRAVVTISGDRSTTTESFEIDKGGRLLVKLTTSFQGRNATTLKRVYDRVEEPS